MTHEKLVINGVTYVPETTEPVKWKRKKYFVHEQALYPTVGSPLWPYRKAFDFDMADCTPCFELFDGEIIISKEDFDKVTNKLKLRINKYFSNIVVVEELKQELFK